MSDDDDDADAGPHGSDLDVSVRRESIGGVTGPSAGLWPAIQSASKSPPARSGSAVATDYRDYSKARVDRVPILDNCVIPTEQVHIKQR